jgi:hypothetical protein
MRMTRMVVMANFFLHFEKTELTLNLQIQIRADTSGNGLTIASFCIWRILVPFSSCHVPPFDNLSNSNGILYFICN